MAFQGIVLVAISLVLAGRGLADDYPHKTAEPQPTGWPLSEEEKTHILKAEHERRPGSESKKHLPELWPVLPSAGFWSGTSWLDTHAKLVEHVKESKGRWTSCWWETPLPCHISSPMRTHLSGVLR